MNTRRRLTPWLLSLLVLLPTAWGCQMSSSSGTAESPAAGSASEAERTRKMQEKAAEIERRAEEIRNMEGTEEEKLQALNDLEKEREELNQMGEGDGSN